MKHFLLFTFLMVINFSFSQEKYRVQYDYQSDNFEYYKLDNKNKVIDTLEKPKFKRNSLVEIKLLNVNPFAVSIETDVKEEELHASSSSGFNFSSLLGGISSMSSTDMQMNINTVGEDMFSARGKSRGDNVSNKFSELNGLQTQVNAMNKTLLADLANPHKSKEEIMKELKNVALIKDSRIADPNKNFHVYIASVKKVLQEDANELIVDIDAMAEEVDAVPDDNQSVSRGELVAKNIAYNKLQSMAKNLNTSTQMTSAKLDEIEELYTTLEASSFDQTYDYEITADKVDIELKFLQSQFADSYDSDNAKTAVKKRSLKMFSKGGFKINTSVAMTLNNFESKSNDFFIDDNGVIGADANNHFTPNLSTMINFYPVLGENVNIGGSFGLSIPISDSVTGVNYLFGPSVFLGNKSRLALSGGVAYGPVKKLTNGLKVGDTTTFNDVDSFTKNIYEFGYYFGISFSLFNLK